jgi:hypothetical protein
MVVPSSLASGGCVVDIVCYTPNFLSTDSMTVLSLTNTLLVNNDDFISRYRLLKYGREKVIENLGNIAYFKGNPNLLL